jgi:hypothetical protein
MLWNSKRGLGEVDVARVQVAARVGLDRRVCIFCTPSSERTRSHTQASRFPCAATAVAPVALQLHALTSRLKPARAVRHRRAGKRQMELKKTVLMGEAASCVALP